MSRDINAAPLLAIPILDGQAEEVVNNGALPPLNELLESGSIPNAK